MAIDRRYSRRVIVVKQIITMIFNYRCYPTPSRIPTLVPGFATHDISVVSFFLMAWFASGAVEAAVVNLVAVGPTVSIFKELMTSHIA